MSQPLVPLSFAVPTTFEGPGFRLEPLGPQHNERDHEAWRSSIDHIRATPGYGPDDDWPVEMSLEANLDDLEMHAKDFANRDGFTYSILDGDEVIGCLYIYPSSDPAYDASVRSWVRASRAGMDEIVYRSVSRWIEASWRFERPQYAPRAGVR